MQEMKEKNIPVWNIPAGFFYANMPE